jgi:pyruvate dehydrogenase E2 component (dihydrolipoamide acetyltransferase)
LTTNVIMPVLGMVQDTGKIVRWLKHSGETVRQGEILMEVETDKAVQELEAPASGILAQILAKEGDVVPVTQVVAVILTPEEYQSTPVVNEMSAIQPASLGAEARSGNLSTQITLTASPVAVRTAKENSRILASPKARRLARETNQDLTTLRGSGPDGAILTRDLESSAAKAPELQIPTNGDITAISTEKPAEGIFQVSQPEAISTIRRRMVEQTSHAWIAPQHFYLHRSAKVAHFLAWHALLQQTSLQKITITDLLVFIVSRALFKHPKTNAIWQDEKINILNEINISLAVALEDGLAAPVIHQADRLNVSEIAKERQELVTRAQSGKLRMEDISGGTFTISNLGTFGVDSFDAVLNSPQAAILAVGRITEQVIPLNGTPVIQPVMNLSVSFDHRVVNSTTGAKFLETLAEMIEEPLMLLT